MKETKFKQTEVGMIPSDWDVRIMSEMTILMTNGFVGSIKNEYVDDQMGPIYIQGFNVEENSFNFTGVKYISNEFHHNHLKSELKFKDLLTVQTGEIGVTAYVTKKLIGGNCQALIISRFRQGIEPIFYSYYFNSPSGRKSLKLIETGSTMKHINVGDMKLVEVPVPSLKEQQRIANALSDVDTLIANLEKLIAKKKNIKQGAMQQLLTGKKRLPGFAPAKPTYKQTELGMIPNDWEFEIFGKLVSIYRGGSPRPIEAYITTNPSGINWIKIGDVDEGAKYITSTQERIIPEGKSRSREVHKGDFILSNSMSFGRPYILKVDGCIHDGWLTIQDYQDTFDTDFLYYMLSSEVVFNQYVSMAAGSSVQNLNKEKVAAVKLFYPPSKTEQTAIANVLSDMDTEISALETKLAKYRTLKTGMMQQLLTGKIRLV